MVGRIPTHEPNRIAFSTWWCPPRPYNTQCSSHNSAETREANIQNAVVQTRSTRKVISLYEVPADPLATAGTLPLITLG